MEEEELLKMETHIRERTQAILEDLGYYILNYGPIIGFLLSLVIGVSFILYGCGGLL